MDLAVNMSLLKPDLHAIAVAEQQTVNYIASFAARYGNRSRAVVDKETGGYC